ncbi:3-phosphoshikimate 1-carboxyvinyltransferase [Candidatus Profftia lariciata]|uniref:3-phosphoshikimate 1-carboxyvinyltransferase n=1 Tax=Candidatus Profftia lariciata TaxID=1987921 RepID=UPI001D022A8A|nr:3-phosphoshikimate 1-carboxyvinyltransferase [Candidatus Profftia lariciata]UDG81460.1 3-phosphoshikimate 1-carboxyvinyltransferase [Candidatus Profftia lariciata]
MLNSITLQPITKFSGKINLPGSKSISNRALLLAALASGTTCLHNLLNSNDVHHMITALKQLGITIQLSEHQTSCEIIGNRGAFQLQRPLKLFLGNAGTAMRPLTAVLCLSNGETILTGDQRMKERPIGHLVDALRQGCAKIDYLEQQNYPPLLINGYYVGGNIEIDGTISSQFLTSLLIMAPLAQKDTIISIKGDLVSKPYIDITLSLMSVFGINIEHKNYQTFNITGNQQYISPGDYLIEGDASSASYFLAAAAIKGGTVRVTGIGKHSVQGDIAFADVLKKMGAKITWGNNFIECTRRKLHAINMNMNHIPDSAMTIATTALFADAPTTIHNIYNWRVKETDRLYAMATELRKVGAKVEEGKDFIRIDPPKNINNSIISTYNDHRIAMCFSLVALSDKPITILDPHCTAKTFPDYFQQFARLSH